MWNNLENQLRANADDATFYAPISLPFNRTSVSESLNRHLVQDLIKVCMLGNEA